MRVQHDFWTLFSEDEPGMADMTAPTRLMEHFAELEDPRTRCSPHGLQTDFILDKAFSLHQVGRGVVSEMQRSDQLEYLFCCDTFNGGFRRIAKNRRFEVLLAALLVSWIGSANALRHQAQISVYTQNYPVLTYP